MACDLNITVKDEIKLDRYVANKSPMTRSDIRIRLATLQS